jgi:hypothetical protein
MPYKSFLTWKEWISCRFFRFHGAALIVIGFPLTIYNGYLSSVIFLIGLVVVFTGPVILIYRKRSAKLSAIHLKLFSRGA